MLIWDAKKGFGRFWGVVSGNFFDGNGYIGPDDGEGEQVEILAIHAPSLKRSFKIRTSDVVSLDILVTSREWTRFRLCLKHDRVVVLTVPKISK